MAKVKSKIEHVFKNCLHDPVQRPFCEDGFIYTEMVHNRKHSFTWKRGPFLDGLQLAILQDKIYKAIHKLPWKDKHDLLDIIDAVVDEEIRDLKSSGSIVTD